MTQKSSYFLFALLLLFGVRSEAQKVTNVHAEQNGNKLEIYYNITQSNSTEVFKVSAHYENEKGVRTELRTVQGDVGSNVIGGKDQ